MFELNIIFIYGFVTFLLCEYIFNRKSEAIFFQPKTADVYRSSYFVSNRQVMLELESQV